MALFKSRKESKDASAGAAGADSVEFLRRRARQRLIGAALLVLVGVVGFPVLFDTQPRPVPVDIPIDIPDRQKSRAAPVTQPLSDASRAPGMASGPAAAPASVTEPAASAVKSTSDDGPGSREAGSKEASPTAPVSPAAPIAKPDAVRPEPGKADPGKAHSPKPEAGRTDSAAVAGARSDDGLRARALLEGKVDPRQEPNAGDVIPPSDRFVVQVGAYAEADKAREVRRQLERAGLKTYTHIADTSDGKRIRVRVGPFPTRPEADRVAQKIKSLGLPVAVLVL